MAKMPITSKLILNPSSGAPGFYIENVFCLPGVPSIMQSMLGGLENVLIGGDPILSSTINLRTVESEIAKSLSKVQERNKGFKKKDYEDIFSRYLGINNFIWLKKGISGDDTHGHIDDIARFVDKNTIMTAVEKNKKDANFKNLKLNFTILSRSKNNNREKFQIIKIPMPSPVFIKKKRVPASYLNFLITNKKVLLPIFNVKEDKKVIKIFKNFFKNKKIIPIDCSKLIWGFGAIHCMTQQEPKF